MKILETHIAPAITEPIRLQEYAVSIFSPIQSRSGLKKAIKKNLLLIDGKEAKTGDWITEGQAISLLQEELSEKKIFNLDLEVLFEDEHIAAILKPAGYPTSGNFFKTIENALPHNLGPSKEPDALAYPLPVHRLDSPTAGILLCAKTTRALLKLQQAFAEKTIQKKYYALVYGKISKEREIDSAIEDKPANTLVKPLNFYQIKGSLYTLVEAKPLTGRTHQIRVHLNNIGYPIVGDKIYGDKESDYFRNKNLFLFSGGIKLQHPVNHRPLEIETKLPKRFRNLNNYKMP
ncbi:RluA family pseudouridine synthase [Christiangramia sabulilitoris]|uniref:RluA family pseudouridine synthase n=1 Tax=Christiangramia sabulilitoris TaxID=2583991 RepID=A0A550I068_9FLAO|nr:RluA family pseudouridine synthase [Christiangramia sabulilitoris]TRO64330.1 RluA family pseudouridine synthase [Christiangramia sabulilitoris]